MNLLLLLIVSLMMMSVAYTYHPSLDSNVFYTLYPALFDGSAPLAVPLQMRWIAIQSETRMEAMCIYHPTCKGKYLKGTIRRPVSEHTSYNRNVAIAYASRRLIIDQSPWATKSIDKIFNDMGLLLNDTSMPVQMGNLVADVIINARHRDGTNQLGDVGGYRHGGMVNFTDYTGYKPVNDHMNIYDPDAWQPLVNVDTRYRPVAQIYLLPHMGELSTWVINTSAAYVADQVDRYSDNRGRYMKKVNDIIHVQRQLTDRQKMVGEWFDNKLKSFNLMGEHLISKYGNNTHEYHTFFNFVVNGVIHEATAPLWMLKTKYDAIRPQSAVRYVKKGRSIKGWGGPGRGIVSMDGKEWRSYLSTDAFPDYPSGTSCLCSSWTEAAKAIIGTNIIDYTVTFPKGSSTIEPGHTPSTDITFTYHTLDEVAEDCMMSRVWGGVHFMQAVTEARRLCAPYGRQFYNKAIKMINGDL